MSRTTLEPESLSGAATADGPPRAYSLPTFVRLRLACGLRVVLAESHITPLVQLHAALPAGVRFELAGSEGLAALTMSALREGTVRRDAARINDDAEELGADILTHADWDMSSAVVELMSSDLPFGVELLFEMLGSPSFPDASIETLRRRQLSRLRQQSSSPADIADHWFARALYGESAYGRPLLGRRSSLLRIGREDLFDFHRTHFGLSGMVVVAVGSFHAEQLAGLLESNSESLSRAEPPEPTAIEPLPLGITRAFLLDLPNAAQTELRVGHVGVARFHPEFASLQLLSAVLGRRLKRTLREGQGYIYHLRCRFVSRSCAGPFAVTAGVGNEHVGEAVREIAREMERLRREPVPVAELDAARNYLTGVYLRAFQPGHEFVTQLKLLAVHDLPDDHFASYLARLAEADAGRLLELARTYLHPLSLAVVAAGPTAVLREQLAECPELIKIGSGGVGAPCD
jgi:zinc protease